MVDKHKAKAQIDSEVQGGMSRRGFLQLSGAAAATVGLSQVGGAAQASAGKTQQSTRQGGNSGPTRIIGLEEHVALPVLLDAWAKAGVPQIPQLGYGDEPFARRLREVGEQRLADMDNQGVDVQVLSLASPGVQNLTAADAVVVAHEANDTLAEIVASNPERF